MKYKVATIFVIENNNSEMKKYVVTMKKKRWKILSQKVVSKVFL